MVERAGLAERDIDEVADESAWQAYVDLAGPPEDGHIARLALLVVGLVVVAMILAGTITILGTGGGGGPSSASASVVDAVSSALGDRTASLSFSGLIEADGQSVPISGTGVSDFTENAMALNMHFGGSGMGDLTEKVEYEGNEVYFNMGSLIGQLLPGKSWVSLDVGQLTGGATKGLGLGGNTLTNNPLAALKFLTQSGNTVTDLGPSSINGTAVEGYSVKMNPATLQHEIQSAKLPGWISQAASQVAGTNVTYVVDVTAGGLLDRMSSTLSLTEAGKHVAETIDMDFSDYGQPVSIPVPPANQVGTFQQFLQSAESQSESTLV